MTINNSVSIFQTAKGTGYMVFPEDVKTFKDFINKIPEDQAIYLATRKASSAEAKDGRIEISSFKLKPKEDTTPTAAEDNVTTTTGTDQV